MPNLGRDPLYWAVENRFFENNYGKPHYAFMFSLHVQLNTSKSRNVDSLLELRFCWFCRTLWRMLEIKTRVLLSVAITSWLCNL